MAFRQLNKSRLPMVKAVMVSPHLHFRSEWVHLMPKISRAALPQDTVHLVQFGVPRLEQIPIVEITSPAFLVVLDPRQKGLNRSINRLNSREFCLP
jgi:hypothetical protein